MEAAKNKEGAMPPGSKHHCVRLRPKDKQEVPDRKGSLVSVYPGREGGEEKGKKKRTLFKLSES